MQNATVIEETGVISCGWYTTRKWLAGAHLLGEWDRSHWACGTSTEQRGKDSQHRFSCAILQRLSCWLGVVKNRQVRRLEPRNHSPFLCSTRGFPEGANICADSIRFHRCNFSGATYLKHPNNTPSIESSWDVVGEQPDFPTLFSHSPAQHKKLAVAAKSC